MPRSPSPPFAAALLLLLLATAPVLHPAARAQDGVVKTSGGVEDRDKEKFRRDIALWEPFERKHVRGSVVTLQFRLHRGWFGPVLVVIYPDGTPEYIRAETTPAGDMWEVSFRCDPRGGKHRVSLVVDSETGDAMAAQFLMHATEADGTPVDRDLELPDPNTEYAALDPEEHPLRLERHLYHRMNAFRRANGLPAIPWHEGVARAAREHMPGLLRYYEDTFDKRLGYGSVKHRVPDEGPGDTVGPDIAQRVQESLGWPVVIPKLPLVVPVRGEGRPNYISEILTAGTTSLDQKFEQVLLRKSDLRAPMLSETTTHAAGAAIWRTARRTKTRHYRVGGPDDRDQVGDGDRDVGTVDGDGPDSERSVAPPRECLAALCFIQVNDPRVTRLDRMQEKAVIQRVSRAADAEEEAAALRILGQHAYPRSARTLEKALKDRDPAIRAAALDGLWLCDPETAREVTNTMRVHIVQAFASSDFSRCAPDLLTLDGVLYDAASAREGRRALKKAGALAREILDGADMRIMQRQWPEATAALEDVIRRFKGLPAAAEAALALKQVRRHEQEQGNEPR